MELSQTVAVVLAGGFGTRIKHLLGDLPKPMAPAAGKPFLEWVTRYLVKQGVRRVVFSTGYRAETVEEHFASKPIPGIETWCVPETTPLGTGGGFLHAAKTSGQRPAAWIVLNGDSLVFADLRAAVQLLDQPQTDGVVVGQKVPDASRYGTLRLAPSNRLVQFDEKRPGPAVINTGIYFFRNALLEKFPSQRPLSMENDVFPNLLQGGAQFQVLTTDAQFLDIGTPESLPITEKFIVSNQDEFQV